MAAGTIRPNPENWPEGIFLSFVALGINIITSIIAVAYQNCPKTRQVVFILMLVICGFIFLSYLLLKHAFLACTWNIKPWCGNKCPPKRLNFYCLRSCFCSWSMVHDVVFCAMALLYLIGDNLDMACEGRYCRLAARLATGASLLLNIALKQVKPSGSKPSLPNALPVIGVMGEAYNKLLKIAADALTIDQTVTTILEAIPISIGSSRSNMDTPVLTVDSREEAQLYAYGIMASASFIVGGIVVSNILIIARANKKAFCGHRCQVWCFDCICKCKKASKDRKGKKANMCESGCLWVFSIVVTLFVLCFMWGDIDWMWNFFEMEHVSHLLLL